ncbi:hypothetical protein EX895_004457 [Sporisorium graminicola]|uniref:LIM zinc-binding domain-containing protein n=1 Tax=Sporisorium graminicola TaxID=280036 RepID=A0A4U7KRZ9_9BASI|nr:hypothetical protein EX895_004457 [Sporisorium graminicola]TKY86816.1 hypothetical protein EX895_004457 [Sporisorium graminicola]
MSKHYQNGSVTVQASAMGTDNVAGFGARRFMQDIYQQSYRAHDDQQYQHRDQPTHHHSYRQDYNAHDPDVSRQSASRSTKYGYHQSPSKVIAALPANIPSHDRGNAGGSSFRDHRLQQHHSHRHGQNQSHAHASAVTRTDADSRTVWRSDSLESSTTESTAGLAYDRSGDSQYSRNEYSASSAVSPSTRRAAVPQITPVDRATIYDDDYEEPADSSTLDAAPRPLSPASATMGDVSSDVSFTIVRATVLEPDLPKAKCADCGVKLDFEELANHSCQPLSASRPPLLTIQVPSSSSSSTLSSSATSPALTTPRSPFFDRYDTLISDSGPLSPAVLGTVTRVDKGRVDDGEDETPKAHAVRIVGTQAAIKVSHVKASNPTTATAYSIETLSGSSPPPQPGPMLRSVSDTQADAAARRKMIEEQRAAKKKKDMMASPMPRAATTTSLSKHSVPKDDLARSASARAAADVPATMPRVHALAALESQHAKTGSSSSVSSSSTDASERTGLSGQHPVSRAGLSTSITPSSSYERIEDGVDKSPAKTVAGSVSPKQARDRGKVDLSSIEEMMKGLTSSPEPMQQTLTDASRELGQEREAVPGAPQRSKSATNATKTDRERALELELERLRDKERTRQLQAMRLRERKKKERAAKRCCICDCSLSSSRTPFVERDGKLLCARDWKELYLPKCRKCNLIVEKGAVKSSDGALRGVFHRSCFSCAACEAPFTDGSFYVFNNQPYCSRHYHRLNGSLCRECECGIEGDCRQTDTGDRFHPHCFSCQYSSKNGSKCAEELADYYVVGGQRLCERHAEKMARRLAKAGQKQLDLRSQKRMTMLRSLR